jgi:cytoskeletal protein CcmA (bactofilin family)
MSEPESPNTIIAAGARLRGELSIEGSVQILGNFEGDITGDGSLHIDESGTCKGNIHVANVAVDGTVEGNITASERIALNPKANVVGDIAAKKIAIADGATFAGNCAIGAQASPPARASRPSTSS